MNTLELKGSILERLANIQDTEVLTKINQFLIQLSKPNAAKERVPEWLTDEQAADLEEALQEMKEGKYAMTHEELMKKYQT